MIVSLSHISSFNYKVSKNLGPHFKVRTGDGRLDGCRPMVSHATAVTRAGARATEGGGAGAAGAFGLARAASPALAATSQHPLHQRRVGQWLLKTPLATGDRPLFSFFEAFIKF